MASAVEGDEKMPPGKAMTMGQHMVDKGAQMLQSLTPIKEMSQHACTFAIYSHDMSHQIETHHFITRINQDFLQCAVYDSDESHCRLIGDKLPIGLPSLMMSPQAVNPGIVKPELVQKRDKKYNISTNSLKESRVEIAEPEWINPQADYWKQHAKGFIVDVEQTEMKKREGIQHHRIVVTYLLPVLVPLRNKQIYQEIHKAQSRQQRIKQLQMVPVNVVPSQPSAALRYPLRRPVHHFHQHRAREVAQRHGAPQEARRHGFQLLGRLRVEEFEKSNYGSRGHGQRGEEQPDGDAVEVGYSGGDSGRLKLKVSWYLNNLGNGTTSLNNINTIKWQAKSEEDSTKEHSHRRSGKAPIPSLMLDKPDEEREAHRPSYTNAQQQPVEEARHLGSLFIVFLVELVGPVRRHRGFHPCRSDRYRVQCHE
nr:oil body-associated protein 2C-like [Ipomoea batatas]